VSGRRFELLEALATETADELMRRFEPEQVVVRVRKQPAGLAVEYSAATAERP
jgi:dihydroneopterin aldolase